MPRDERDCGCGHSGGVRSDEHAGGEGEGGAGGATINFTDHGGPVIQHGRLHLIFWGDAWAATPSPAAGQIIDAVQKICAGPYMWGLWEYRNIRPATLAGVQFAAGTPPNPFADSDVSALITSLINAQRLPAPATDSQLIYMVITPNGVGSGGSFVGEHTFFSFGGVNAHFGWVTNNGSLNSVTSIFSHELVETCTDPEGSAILGDPGSCSQGGWCEIGDVCYINGVINGVTVQQYWSQRNKSCVLSDSKYQTDNKSAKDSKDQKDTKDPKEHKDAKDAKDHKDHKDVKEGAKEKEQFKEKDAKEKDREAPAEIASQIALLATQIGELAGRVTGGSESSQGGGAADAGHAVEQTFIRPAERPPVGEEVINEEEEQRG